jgi:EmrB/QacA subfamily drug resistance transporter
MNGEQPARVGLVFSGLVLVLLLAALDQTIVATALPTIVGDFGGLEHISWVVSAYLLGQTAVTPLYGKLGDLLGRKRVLQFAVVLFLIGSALCGLAQSMTTLIVFRAVQGLGAGGLIVLTQATIGDVVPPRERGRYQGIFGGVFGISSVAGPLIGGLIVEHVSWRWVFYVNLPIGLLALVVLAVTLPAGVSRGRPVIDYLGAGLLATGLAAIVLVTSLGGTTWEWGSFSVIFTAALGVGALVAFALVERAAAEPVLPPALWRERVFAVAGALSLIVGFALFGAVTFLPLYFQTVDAASPSESGLRLVPMMLGVLVTSIGSGQAISRFGRYKAFPVVGTLVMAVGMLLLSRLDAGTSTLVASVYLLVLGLGLGLVMQVLVLAVQNAVPFAVLGAATSGVTLMRGIGGSLGTAVFGSIFTHRLTARLTGGGLPPELRAIVSEGGRLTGAQVSRLPAGARLAYEEAYVYALTPVFLVAAGVATLGFLLSWLLPEKPLRATAATSTGLEDGLAAPKAADSLAEIERALSVATTLEQRREFRRAVASRAGLDVSPGAVWALVRIARDGMEPAGDAARARGVSDTRIAEVIGELQSDGLLDSDGPTARGIAYADQLVSARREVLREVLDDRDAELDPDVNRLLGSLAQDLVGEVPSGNPSLRRSARSRP